MIGKKIFSLTLLGTVLCSSLSYGKNLKDTGFLTPQFGIHTFENRNIDDKFTYGLSLERVFNGWGIGGYFGLIEGNDYKDAALYLSKYYSVKDKLYPFISFGVGANTFNDDKRSLLGPYIAVGFYYLIKGNWNFYFSLKDFYLWKGRNDLVPTIGISYMFGKKVEDSDGDGVSDVKDTCPDTPRGVPVDINGCPLDSDKDGVPDYRDKCPNTPEGIKVNIDGCAVITDSDKDGVADNIDRCPNTPVGIKVNRYGCPIDSDLDGVPDYKDKCPKTVIGTKVDENGCPLDSDGDGVLDNKDECPDTPKGVKVDSTGCPIDSDKDSVPDYLDKCPDTPIGTLVDKKGCPVLLDSDNDGVPDDSDECPDTPAGVIVDRLGCPLDSDNDGIPDYKDKCPNTPQGISVDEIGCPLDSDKDGVPDYRDRCPDTPQGMPTDLNGCPVDSDNDGVPDIYDECPNTPEGAKVDEKGCMKEVRLEIYFDLDSAEVKPEYYPEIEKIARFLKEHPDIKVEIQGHTDSLGSASYNLKLSQRRAEAVKKVLVEKFGISAGRIIAKGYGETKPIAPNDTEEGRAKNRRVVVIPIK